MTTESDNLKAFLQAAKAGDLATLRNLLDSGIDPNYKAPWPDGNGVDEHGAPAIVRASMYGQLSAVKLLIDRGADIDNRNEYPMCSVTALHTAAISGHVEIVKLLVARGAKAESGGFETDTTTLAACAGEDVPESTENHMEIIKLLLENGHDIEACNEHGARPLILAARHGKADLLRLLLDRGANINAGEEPDDYGTAPLDEAAMDGCLELVQLLFDRGADNKHRTKGFTAFHKAAAYGQVEVMKLLFRKGAHAEAFETRSATALHWAAPSSISFLLSNGFKIEARTSTEGNTPLLVAANEGSTRRVEVLLDSGADINARNDRGETALHLATFPLNVQDSATYGTSRYPRLELIKLLLSRGADFTIVDHDGKQLLHRLVQGADFPARTPEHKSLAAARRACCRGDIDAIELLISLGADVNVPDNKGETVLHRAAHEWNPEIIQMLLEVGADVEARKIDGSTPLFETVALGPLSRGPWWVTALTMKVLLDAGANVNARKNNGRTVLHELVVMDRNLGCSEGCEIIVLLLERGVDTEVRDSNGETALQLAERLGRSSLVEVLRTRSRL